MTEMAVITEGSLQLRFPPGWQAIKFDDQPWYRHNMGGSVKAVDIIAFDQQDHWWIEIKDCAGTEPANRPRLSPSDPPEVAQTRAWIAQQGWQSQVRARRAKPFLVDEVAAKVEGTLTSLATAARAGAGNDNAAAVQPCLGVMQAHALWTVVVLLTWSEPDFPRLASLLQTKLAQRLRAFHVTCRVVNETMTAPALPWTLSRVSP